jgi:hypothetical protein
MSTEDTAPAPPTGYRPYTLDPDRSLGMVARVLAAGWLLAVGVLGGLVWVNHDRYTVFGVVVVVTIVVHEAVHAVVGWMLGLELTAGFDIAGLETGPYILPYGDFQTRRESVLLAAAPTLVLTPLLLLVIGVGGTASALAALFVNTLGAVADLRVVVTALQIPSGALEYHTADGEIRYYTPVE